MEDMMELIENRDAQFMLLAGFIIAIGLVITTVMLNSVIFEGNMAIGAGNDPSKNEMVNLMQITKDETGAAYRNTSNASMPRNKTIANFIYQTQDFRDNLSTIYALNGDGVNLSWNVSNWNNSNYAYFTDNGMANGAAKWVVIQNASSSNITVNVATGSFIINVTNTTNTSKYWTITLSGGYQSFNSTNISSNVPPPYSITFLNAASATGNYSINGTASGRAFTRARDYILYANVTFSTGRVNADITIPISVPW
jgi:hypothetical protein